MMNTFLPPRERPVPRYYLWIGLTASWLIFAASAFLTVINFDPTYLLGLLASLALFGLVAWFA